MKTGTGLALIAVGAIFAFAVTANTSVLNLHVMGWVLMIIGVIGIAVPARGYAWVGRRMFVRQSRWRPDNRAREEVIYPTNINQSPANTRVQAGLPAPSPVGSREASEHIETTRDLSTDPAREPRPGQTEVVEDIYEET
jgi:hypothetical protein